MVRNTGIITSNSGERGCGKKHWNKVYNTVNSAERGCGKKHWNNN